MILYSRNNPSPHYQNLLAMYRQLHEKGVENLHMQGEETFTGISIGPYVPRIKELCNRFQIGSLLDYGSGKGMAWKTELEGSDGKRYSNLKEYLGLEALRCYDPGYEPYKEFPAGQHFDAVVAMDVLEHIPEADLPWMLDEIFEFSTKLVVANIACFPAMKHLPNGENAHCTVKPVEWWEDLLEGIAAKHPEILWEFWFIYPEAGPAGTTVLETAVFSSVDL